LSKEPVVSREDYIAVAVRLFAVYVAFKIVLSIPATVQVLSQDQGMTWAGLSALTLMVGWGFCALLWFFPLTIARKLLPVMKEHRSEQAIDASVGLSLGLTLIGLWLLAQGVIDVFYWLVFIVRTNGQDPQSIYQWAPDQVASMVAAGLEVFVGAYLMLGSAVVRRFIHKLRFGAD